MLIVDDYLCSRRGSKSVGFLIRVSDYAKHKSVEIFHILILGKARFLVLILQLTDVQILKKNINVAIVRWFYNSIKVIMPMDKC